MSVLKKIYHNLICKTFVYGIITKSQLSLVVCLCVCVKKCGCNFSNRPETEVSSQRSL